MSSPYENELITKAEQFCSFLQNYSVKGKILENSLRGYHIKIELFKENIPVGKGVIYFSPSKNSFRLVPENITNEEIKASIVNYWFQMVQPNENQTEEAKSVDSNKGNFEVEIYVDGCFKNNKTGYGAVILKDGKPIAEFSGLVPDDEVKGTNQIAGELQSVIVALEWCMKKNVKTVKIYHDLENTQKWATGEYRAKKPVSQRFVEFIQKCGIKIIWEKVLAHSANRWNDYVDGLAKKATEGEETQKVSHQLNEKILDKIITEFLNFMNKKNIEILLEKRINANNYARFRIKSYDESDFIIELYHTETKPLNFQIRGKTSQYHSLKMFCENFKIQLFSKGKEGFDRYEEAEYFYTILKPYENYNFDFIDFANSLKDLDEVSQEIEKHRYDFRKLESVYIEKIKLIEDKNEN